MKKIIITLLLIAGLSACGASEGPSSVAETTTTTTATEETTTTTTVTTTETPTLDDSESNIEYVGEKTYDDGTVVKLYLYNENIYLSEVYLYNDDPNDSINKFTAIAATAEVNLENASTKPDYFIWRVYNNDNLVFIATSVLGDDGTYSPSPSGIVWYDDDFEKAADNLNTPDTTIDDDEFETYPTVYEDDNVTIKFCGIGKDYYDIDDSVIFYVENKNDFEITIQCSSISLDGIQIDGDPVMSDEVAPLSKAKVYASFESGIDNKNPSFISGVLSVIDWSTEHFMPYNATFRNVDV